MINQDETEVVARALYVEFYPRAKDYPWPPKAANKWRSKAIRVLKALDRHILAALKRAKDRGDL